MTGSRTFIQKNRRCVLNTEATGSLTSRSIRWTLDCALYPYRSALGAAADMVCRGRIENLAAQIANTIAAKDYSKHFEELRNTLKEHHSNLLYSVPDTVTQGTSRTPATS
jgi:hypothetical protein